MLIVSWFILAANPATVKAEAGIWSVPMTAVTATEGSNPNLAFGTSVNATDGLDSGIDIPHPPPASGATFDAYFQIVHPLFPNLDKDYRAPAASIQWTLKTNSQSENIILTWDVSGLPANVQLRISEAGKPDIDMQATGSTILPAGTHTLTVGALTITPPTVTTVPADNITTSSANTTVTTNADKTDTANFTVAEKTGEPPPPTQPQPQKDKSVELGSGAPEEKSASPIPPIPPPPPAPVGTLLNWPMVWGIIAGVIIVGLLAFFLIRRRAY